MDRWYNAEDGNIWLTFPSAERNKVDLETFLILKKEHSSNEPVPATAPSTMANEFVTESARYKIIAIENEAPLFVKTKLKPAGSIQDDGTIIGSTISNYPLPGNFQVRFEKDEFEQASFATVAFPDPNQAPGLVIAGTEGSLYLQDYSKFKMRAKVPGAVDGNTVSNWYDIENVSFSTAANGSYTVTFTEKFKQDMSITSATSGPNAYTDRYSNVIMELGVETVENKPEFDGRFFVKIKKDSVIQERIIKETDPGTADYSVLNAMQCQYISPYDTEQKCLTNQSSIVQAGASHYFANFYGATPMQTDGQSPPGWDGGFPKHYLLSTANHDNSQFGAGDTGDYAINFWKKASYGDDDPSGAYHTTSNPNGKRSQSSGWFIDKIEGFRRTKAAWKNFGKIKPLDPGGNNWSGYGTHHEDDLYEYNHEDLFTSGTPTYGGGGDQQPTSIYYTSGHAGPFGPSNQMQLEGTCTLGSRGNTWNDYLNIEGAKGPHNTLLYDYTLSGGNINNKGTGFNFVYGESQASSLHAFMQDNGIIPSQGINENVIHLSYSGIGDDEAGGTSSSQYNDTSNNYFEYSSSVAQNHVADIEFINTITTPGSIWRWKEDPGLCVYQTQRYNPSVDSSYVMGDWDVALNAYMTPINPSFTPGIPLVKHGPPPADPITTFVSGDLRNSLEYLDATAVMQDGGLWNFNTFDHAEGQNQLGIALYNYASFLDYPVDNPSQTGIGSLIGGYDYSNEYDKVIANMKFCSSVYNGSMSSGVTTCAPWALTGSTVLTKTHSYYATAMGGGFGTPAMTNMGINTPSQHYAGFSNDFGGKWPMMTRDWGKPYNKRRRFQFIAKALEEDPTTGERYNLGEAPAHVNAQNPGFQHHYLPTNDPTLNPHFASNNQVLDLTTSIGNDNAGDAYPTLPNTPAPGVRSDGMHSGYPEPSGSYTMTTGSETNKTFYTIPYLRTEDGSGTRSQIAGSFTWEILTQSTSWNDEQLASTSPAIWETEPKEDIGLDIYHEVGQIYPVELTENTIEQFLGPIKDNLIENSKVTCYTPTTGIWKVLTNSGNGGDDDIRVKSSFQAQAGPNYNVGPNFTWIELADTLSGNPLIQLSSASSSIIPDDGDILFFTRADGSVTSTTVLERLLFGARYRLDSDLHNYEVTLPFHNCYSFGNGVESDRVRDDYNQVTIDNGPKASTTLEEPYKEERRGSGLIYSGIYNSMSGVNNLNQFVQAEKITKDLNPKYGTIQKLHTRNTNLLTLCEDKVFKILANKDALYNADGSMNLVATENVLGQATPMLGEYGISTNPESFASESYRTYFTDRVRGAVIRLSQDGVTPVSDVGMKDYFGDTLPQATRIIGSVDDRKEEYNITVDYSSYKRYPAQILGASKTGVAPFTPLFKLIVIGLEAYNAFKINSIISGPGIPVGTRVNSKTNLGGGEYEIIISQSPTQQDVANLPGPNPYSGAGVVSWTTNLTVYRIIEELPSYTVSFSEASNGWVSFKSWIHEDGISLNNEYYTFKGGNIYQHHIEDVPRNTFYGDHTESSVQVLFNENPSNVKSFQTLNYEGTQSRITEDFEDNQYWDNEEKFGWYVDNIHTDLQEGKIHEFKDKEGKWFSQVQGETTEWLDDGTGGNIDTSEFSYQGIDELSGLQIINGGYTSWDCLPVSIMCRRTLVQLPELLAGVDVIGSGPTGAGILWKLPAVMWCIDNAPSSPFDDFVFEVLDTVSNTTKYLYMGTFDGTGGTSNTGNDILHALNTSFAPYLGAFPTGTPSSSIRTGQFVTDPVTNQSIEIYEGRTVWATSGSGGGGCTGAITSTFQCTEIQGPPGPQGGAYPDEPTCLADTNSPCAPIPETYNCDTGICVDPGDGTGTFTGVNALIDCQTICTPCSSVPLSINTVNATTIFSGGSCSPDGQVEVGASTTGPFWNLEIYTQTGTLVYTDPSTYASGTTSNVYSSLNPGNYIAEVTDSFGCVSVDPFVISCITVTPTCTTTGPFKSILGLNTSPHQFLESITTPTSPNCNDGVLEIQNISLGNNGISTPSIWSVTVYQGVPGSGSFIAGPVPNNIQGGSYTVYNLQSGDYYYEVEDYDGCVYTYGATIPACVNNCQTTNIPNGPWPSGACSNWDGTTYGSDPSAFLGHFGNGTVNKIICTDRCEGGFPDAQVIDPGMHTYWLGCIPTDAAYVKIFYYGSNQNQNNYACCTPPCSVGSAQLGNTDYDPLNPTANPNLCYSDPTHYTGNQYVVWDTVEPNPIQMACGPMFKNNTGGYNTFYRFKVAIRAYDANNVLVGDVNGNACSYQTSIQGQSGVNDLEIPCHCGPGQPGTNGYNCVNNVCVQHVGVGSGMYTSLYHCQNGQGNNPACGNVVSIPGCTDPNASNYNPLATVNDGSCIYPSSNPCPTNDYLADSDFSLINNGNWIPNISGNLMHGAGGLGIMFPNAVSTTVDPVNAMHTTTHFANDSLTGGVSSNWYTTGVTGTNSLPVTGGWSYFVSQGTDPYSGQFNYYKSEVKPPIIDGNGHMRLSGAVGSFVHSGGYGGPYSNPNTTPLGWHWCGIYQRLTNLTNGTTYRVTITLGTDWNTGLHGINPGASLFNNTEYDANGVLLTEQLINQGATLYVGGDTVTDYNGDDQHTLMSTGATYSTPGPVASPIKAFYGPSGSSASSNNTGEMKPGGILIYDFVALGGADKEYLMLSLRSMDMAAYISIEQVCIDVLAV